MSRWDRFPFPLGLLLQNDVLFHQNKRDKGCENRKIFSEPLHEMIGHIREMIYCICFLKSNPPGWKGGKTLLHHFAQMPNSLLGKKERALPSSRSNHLSLSCLYATPLKSFIWLLKSCITQYFLKDFRWGSHLVQGSCITKVIQDRF